MNTNNIESPEHVLTTVLGGRSREERRKRKDAIALEAVASAPRRNDLLPQIKLEQRSLASLRAPARALRKLCAEHVAEIARSMAAFGFVRPLLITADGTIVDGVSSAEAARTIDLDMAPCVVIDHLNADEIRVLRLTLNRMAEKGHWDIGELKIEFKELLEIDAPIELSGFSLPEIDIVVMQDEPLIDAEANDTPDVALDVPAVSRLGDIWKLGRHRLFCGDATQPQSFTLLFDQAPLACAVFTDPPYNIQIDGFAVGAGAIKHREFVAASGEMTDDEFDKFLTSFLTAAAAHLVENGVLFVCMDWRHAEQVQRAARCASLCHVNTAVWVKGNGGLGGLYRSAHEFVLVLKKGTGAALNNVELGKHGRDRTNVWPYPGANQRGSSANAEMLNHPTPKPVELVADALLDVTARGDIVLDPFAGSGTTVVAAEKTGRTAFAMELDPHYVDLIVRRYQNFTGHEAVHTEIGTTFAQVAEARGAERVLAEAPTVCEIGPPTAHGDGPKDSPETSHPEQTESEPGAAITNRPSAPSA